MAKGIINFDLPVDRSSIIKVIGIGGGGSNAVNHMFRQGIKDVNFVVCNTDAQALINSPVSVKIQIGESLTEGRGAGNKPEIGRQAAIENLDDILEVLSGNTKMVFITAGMGGGTGTGAAPVIAKAVKELNILTVAIVTIPFRFEGQLRVNQAIDGINELKKHVDSLLVINNEKLREIYGDLKLSEAFSKADDVLTIAAKSIAEIITVHGYINVDFADVEAVMINSGVVIMGSATAEGKERAVHAIQQALTSPLLNNNDITGAENILLNITSGINEISMDEVHEITDYVSKTVVSNTHIIWGTGTDEKLGEKISITIIATGFETNSISELYVRKKQLSKILLDEDSPINANSNIFFKVNSKDPEDFNVGESGFSRRTIEFDEIENNENKLHMIDQVNKPENNEVEENPKQADNKGNNLKKYFAKLKKKSYNNVNDNENIDKLEDEPAYIRKKIKIENLEHSSDSNVSKYSLSEDDEKKTRLKSDNSYLHDNVD